MKKTFANIFFFFVCAIHLLAQPPVPDHAGKWVIDDAGVLSESTKSTVSAMCQDEFDSTSNQVVVYLFNSLEGGTIESYANEVYNKWKIGSKENNNGILLIIAINDRKMRIEVGYGLETYLTDLEAKDIINNEIKPRFKEGNYNQGVLDGVENIIYGIRNSYVAPYNPYQNVVQNKSVFGSGRVGVAFWITTICWLAMTVWFSRMKIGEGISANIFFIILIGYIAFIIWPWLPVLIMLLSAITFQILLHYIWKPKKLLKFWGKGGGGGSWSGGSYTSSSYTSSYNSSSYSSGGGGFSGGGGSSGGGGASGDW